MPAMRTGPLKTAENTASVAVTHDEKSKEKPNKKNKSKKARHEQVDSIESAEEEETPSANPEPAEMDENILNSNIERDAADIKELVQLIPAIHYRSPDANKQLSLSVKYMKKAGTTVSDKVARAHKKRKKFSTGDKEEVGPSGEDKEDQADDSGEDEEEPQRPAEKGIPSHAPATTRVKSVAELQARLQERIMQIRGNRPASEDDSKDQENKKRLREERKEKKKKKQKVQDKKPVIIPTPAPMPKEASRTQAQKGADDEVIEAAGGAETEEGKALAQQMRWGAVIDRAQGVKVKDDAGLLKKTIKKKQHQKDKSKDKWLMRAEKIEEQRSKRIKERNENVEKRKSDRRDKKLGIKKIKKKPAGSGGPGGPGGGGGGGFLKDFGSKERRPGFEGRGPRS